MTTFAASAERRFHCSVVVVTLRRGGWRVFFICDFRFRLNQKKKATRTISEVCLCDRYVTERISFIFCQRPSEKNEK